MVITKPASATVTCGCGKELKTQRAMAMHETSKLHKAWLDRQSVVSVDASVMDETLVAALRAATEGLDPRQVAKMVRSVFNRKEWPDGSHGGTVADWLQDHNIPIVNVPSHTDPDDHRQYISSTLSDLKSRGYGTERWEIKE